MTREEAIAQLKMDRDLCNFNPMTGEEEPMNEDCRKSAEALDMAIKALEQQPCEDTISRQAAIDALAEWHDVAITNRLNNLPPAQPSVSKTETVEDCISRQAAIDAAFSLCEDCDSGYCGSCRVNYPGEKDVIKVIRNLPSAQPERKKGRWIDMDDHVMCSCCGATHYGSDKNFCPNCGADMRRNE